MKFNCPREELMQCIHIVSRAIPSKSTIPALEGIHMTAQGDTLTLKCSDLELCIESSVPAMIEEEGRVVLPGRLFSEMVKKLTSDSVLMEMDDSLSCNIECGRAKLVLQGMDPADYPEMPPIADIPPVSIRQKDLKDMIHKTVFAVALDETKPILTGVLIEMEQDRLTLVALDGYRLAMCNQMMEQVESPIRFVVPSKPLSEIARLFDDENADVKISVGASQASLDLGNTKVVTRLLQGEYIKYRQILPAEYQTRVQVNTRLLEECVDRASLMAREGKNNLIKLSIKDDMISITANSEIGSVYEEVPVVMEGKGLDIAFNAKYLMDALRAIEDEEIMMDFNTNLSPCLIHPVSGQRYTYLVLPVRIYA